MEPLFVYEEIDRTIYNLIRIALIGGGYLPDIDTFVIGKILTHSLGAGVTSGYAVNDTFTINTGTTLATGKVDTVDVGGVVLTYSLTGSGGGYAVAAGLATTNVVGTGTGLTINVLTILTEAAAQQAYKDAKTALGPNLIEIFGVGTGARRGKLDVNRIVIDRKSGRPAATGVGGYPSKQRVATVTDELNPANNRWRLDYLPEGAEDITYDIRCISSSAEYDRIMSFILKKVIGWRRYLQAWKADLSELSGKRFLTYYNSDLMVVGGGGEQKENEWLERMHLYTAADIWIDIGPNTIMASVVPLTSIDFRVFLGANKPLEQPDSGTPDAHILIETS